MDETLRGSILRRVQNVTTILLSYSKYHGIFISGRIVSFKAWLKNPVLKQQRKF